jgi:hypothetical protein
MDDENILKAIERRDGQAVGQILLKRFRKAARQASLESHALGLKVADGRAEARGPNPHLREPNS